MKTPHEQVMEFHKAFGAPVGAVSQFPERLGLRTALISEEYEEMLTALDTDDFEEWLDALGDLVYVIYGAAIEAGVNLDHIVKEIHDSNMSKLDIDGNPILREDGKILKGSNYFEPNIFAAINLP